MTAGDPSVRAVRADRLALRTGGRILLLPHDRIVWIGARNMRCEVHLLDSTLTVNRLLKDLLAELPAGEFLRINRSEVINRAMVTEFRPKSHGDGIVVLREGTELVVSRRRRREILKVLTQGGIAP